MTNNTSDKSEKLPLPLKLTSDTGFKAYTGLPAYNGPDSFLPRRSNGVDYAANSAGFVVSDLRPDASSSRPYEMASSSSRVHQQYNQQRVPFKNYEKRSRSDFSAPATESSGSADIDTYLKTAASETSQTEQSSSSIPYSSAPAPTQRRKPTFDKSSFDEQHGTYNYDPAMNKHFLKTHFRDSELSPMESGNNEHTSASNDNELAHLAASMSELQNSNSGNSDMFQSNFGGMGGPSELSGLDAHSFGGLGSLGSGSMNSPMPLASSMQGMNQFGGHPSSPGFSPSNMGVPAGAIVGAPGSAPPPGMKLAGYVTMAGQQGGQHGMGGPGMGGQGMGGQGMGGQGMGSQGMGGPGMNGPGMGPMGGMPPMGGPQMGGMMNQMNMMRSPMMSPSMRYPGMMSPPPGMGGPGYGHMGSGMPGMPGMHGMPQMGGINPALQQMISSTFGGQMPKGLTGNTQQPEPTQSPSTSGSSQGSQASASSSAPQRTFLSRLNPMNLFRRLRSRNQPKDDLGLEPMLTSESQRIMRRRPFMFRRSGDFHNDTMALANSPFGLGMYRRSFSGAPSTFRFPSESPFPARRGRRLMQGSSRLPQYETSESRPVGLMGSGNFEVIRGGFYNANGHNDGAQNAAINANNNGQQGSLDPEDANVFSTIEDDLFGSGQGILGFQGFNHFSGAPVFNSLSPSTQKKVEIQPSSSKLTTVANHLSTPLPSV
ncbi:hypothetical protein HDE_02364 [Halotydeus destructor]|nr:hypothetical protein HDE_02364 [Halotydeus destructor]